MFVIVPSGEIRIGGQEHFYMETQSMLVVPVGEETEFNVYASTQWPTLAQVHRYFDLFKSVVIESGLHCVHV